MEDVGSGMMLSHPSRRNEELVKNAELLALQRLDGNSPFSHTYIHTFPFI